MSKAPTMDHRSGLEVAIIGMSGRFPGAKNIDIFWQNLRDGIESISSLTDHELRLAGIDPDLLSNPNYIKAKGILEDTELFDASFFGFSPRDAEIMDPQHRVFMECAWEALEMAGCDPERYKGLIGVYAGVSPNGYFLNNLHPNRKLMESVGDLQARIGNDKDFIATHVAYKMNLRGPAISIQTACSTSLVAVCQACQGLLSGECDIALAGASSIHVPGKAGYLYQHGGIGSPDGHCRAFDAEARGTVLSEGVGVVVLKRLDEAIADGDCIHAVIKGSAINNDGSFKAGYTAPSVDGQAKVIRTAHVMAEIEPETVTYVETHGTATPLGDPIEIAALTQAFRAGTQKKGFCAIGSVKTNIGHTDVTAGVAGLIKTVLMLKNKKIVPSLHFSTPNPEIDFESSPFFVNTELKDWVSREPRLRAGVSSFGVGGTNAHVIVEEAPDIEDSTSSRSNQLMLLSAKTISALETITADLVTYLKQHPEANLADVAYTLHTGRKTFKYRRALLCESLQDATATLEVLDSERVLTAFREPRTLEIAFMFSGQGSQYINMGSELYKTELDFRKEIDRCSEILQPHLDLSLRDLLYPEGGSTEELTQQLMQTSITQPALFTVEYALAKLWMSWGVHPAAMVGHSIGEYVAACLSGVLSLEDALLLVAIRGRLMRQMPTGSMLAVHLSEKDIKRFLTQDLSLATVNAPSLCVLSGKTEAVTQLENDLRKNDVAFTRLHTSHAFHSKMMEPILTTFAEQVRRLRLNPPQIPFVSNLTGTWITSEDATSPDYWANHLRQTVRFSDCVMELLKEPSRILLEVGPGHALSTFARQHLNGTKKAVVLSSLRHPKEEKSDSALILNTLGQLWLEGVEVDWSGFYKDERRHRLPLPTYPFEGQRYWIEPQQSIQEAAAPQKKFQKNPNMADWFYVPSWKQSPRPNPDTSDTSSDRQLSWLLFLDEYGLGERLGARLRKEGHRVTTVKAGESFHKELQGRYIIDPKERMDYQRLLQELKTAGSVPHALAHLWCLWDEGDISPDKSPFELASDFGFNSLLFLAQAIGDHLSGYPLSIKVVLNSLWDVTGNENLSPEKAIVLGPCRVIPREYPNVTCSSIDIDLQESKRREELEELLMGELKAKTPDTVVAYRGKHRWIQMLEPSILEKALNKNSKIRRNGVYLITGGLGGIGLALAEYLAQTAHAKLILVSRKGLPNKNEWERWIELHGEGDVISRKIQKVKRIEAIGSEVLILATDVTDTNQMKSVYRQALDRFGKVHGVIHAAGVAGGGLIQLKTAEVARNTMAPKITGTLVLANLLSGVDLDFFLLCSSLTSVLEDVGQVDYCAANAFLDAYAQKHHSQGRVVAVNWCAWQEVGMVVNTEVPPDLKRQRDMTLKLGVTPDEGKEAFSRILNSSLPQVLVSTREISIAVAETKNTDVLSSGEKPAEEFLAESMHPRPTLSNEHVAPANPVEQTIADIWQELFRIEKIGVYDNFFELGGHSLLAVQLFTRIRKWAGIDLPLAILFESPTVRALAEVISKNSAASGVTISAVASPVQQWRSLVVIQQEGDRPPLFLVHAAGGNVLNYRNLLPYLGPDQPVYGLQARGLDGILSPHSSMEEMVSHYIDEITSVQPSGPYFLGGGSFGGIVALEIAQQLTQRGEKVAFLALLDSVGPGSCGYRRRHLQGTNLSETRTDASTHLAQMSFLPLYLSKRIHRSLSGRASNLTRLAKCGLCRLRRRPIPLKLRDWYLSTSYERLLLGHTPRNYAGRITLFRGPAGNGWPYNDPALGWKEIAKGDLRIITIPAPHGTFIESAELGARFAEELRAAQEETA